MPPAFRNGSIDIALSLCPEIAAELELAPIRKERLVVLLPEAHRSRMRTRSCSPHSPTRSSWCFRGRSHRGSTTLSWPSTVAPGLSRESETSHSTRAGTWVLAEIRLRRGAANVAGGLPDGIVAVALSEPTDSLETPGLARR